MNLCPQLIDKELLDELPIFETFLNKIGFKRIDGSVFGLLVLSDIPLTSQDIQANLNISQSAVSQSVKMLESYGAISISEIRSTRTKLYSAKEDSLAMVASLFRKRELEYIEDVRRMTKRVISKTKSKPEYQKRLERLDSIGLTCDIGEAIINFLIQITHDNDEYNYKQKNKRLQSMLELLSTSKNDGITSAVKSVITSKLKDGLMKFTGDQK